MGSERGSVKGLNGRILLVDAMRDTPNEREERERNALRDAPNEREEREREGGTPSKTLRE